MSDSGTRRLIMELDPGEPISGSMQAEGHVLTRFAGWMELVALLEDTRGVGAKSDGDETSSGVGA